MNRRELLRVFQNGNTCCCMSKRRFATLTKSVSANNNVINVSNEIRMNKIITGFHIYNTNCTSGNGNKIMSMQMQHRMLSSSASATMNNNNNNKRQNNANDQQPLVNEYVIRFLLQSKHKNKKGYASASTLTADTLQVRLLIDETLFQSYQAQLSSSANASSSLSAKNDYNTETDNYNDKTKKSNQQSTTELVSLSQAINIATICGVDLVGISLQQEIPVLRAVDFSKFLYEQSLKLNKQKKSIHKNMKSNKEFTFRAGIDPNDLERKANNMISYLQKGHSCQIVITSKRRNLIMDQDVIQNTLERIQFHVGEYGNPQGILKTNPNGNRGTLLFQPKSKK